MAPLLVAHNSRSRYALMLVGALGFVAAGVLMVVHGHGTDRWVGWSSILFFGAMVPLFIRQLFDARPRVLIDEHGVLDRTLGIGVIPWGDIADAYVKSVRGSDFVCLVLRNADERLRQLTPAKQRLVALNRNLGFQPFNVNLSGTDLDSHQVLDVILKLSARQDA